MTMYMECKYDVCRANRSIGVFSDMNRRVNLLSGAVLFLVCLVLILPIVFQGIYNDVETSNGAIFFSILLCLFSCYVGVNLIINVGDSSDKGFAGILGWKARLVLTILLLLIVIVFIYTGVNIWIFIYLVSFILYHL